MCKTSDLIVIVADADKESLKRMCSALFKLNIEKMFCATSATEALKISIDLKKKKRFVSMLFCSTTIVDISIHNFVEEISKVHPGLISITYSKCNNPESHIFSMLNYGSMDYIEQTEKFEENVEKVFNRWWGAVKLQCEYGIKYGASERTA